MRRLRVALLGNENVGKSSLLNALVGEKTAIVTPMAGTTRGAIRGFVGDFEIIDTPGMHRQASLLGKHMRKSISGAVQNADVILFVLDAVRFNAGDVAKVENYRPRCEASGIYRAERSEAVERRYRERYKVGCGQALIVVVNKADMMKMETLYPKLAMLGKIDFARAIVPVSAKTGFNIDVLEKELRRVSLEKTCSVEDCLSAKGSNFSGAGRVSADTKVLESDTRLTSFSRGDLGKWEELARGEFEAGDFCSAEYLKRDFDKIKGFVLKSGEEWVGAGFVDWKAHDFNPGGAHFLEIVTFPKFRGRGFGHVLMRAMLGASEGYRRSACIRGDNAESVGLFKAHGFEKVGTHKDWDVYIREADEEAFTDQSVREMAGEILRGAVIKNTRAEIPHGVAVVVTDFIEKAGAVEIRADILCEKAVHKPILIGAGGAMLKRIGIQARKEIEKMLGDGRVVRLYTRVVVRPDWKNDAGVVGG